MNTIYIEYIIVIKKYKTLKIVTGKELAENYIFVSSSYKIYSD